MVELTAAVIAHGWQVLSNGVDCWQTLTANDGWRPNIVWPALSVPWDLDPCCLHTTQPEVRSIKNHAQSPTGSMACVEWRNYNELLCIVLFVDAIRKYLLAFSVRLNGLRILSVERPPADGSTLPALHGIRFLSMTWVILGHTYVFALLAASKLSRRLTKHSYFPDHICRLSTLWYWGEDGWRFTLWRAKWAAERQRYFGNFANITNVFQRYFPMMFRKCASFLGQDIFHRTS